MKIPLPALNRPDVGVVGVKGLCERILAYPASGEVSPRVGAAILRPRALLHDARALLWFAPLPGAHGICGPRRSWGVGQCSRS